MCSRFAVKNTDVNHAHKVPPSWLVDWLGGQQDGWLVGWDVGYLYAMNGGMIKPISWKALEGKWVIDVDTTSTNVITIWFGCPYTSV